MSRKFFVALSFAVLASAPAFAATFEEVDANGDGMISAEEAAQVGLEAAAADTNGDGSIDQPEFDAAMGGTSQ